MQRVSQRGNQLSTCGALAVVVLLLLPCSSAYTESRRLQNLRGRGLLSLECSSSNPFENGPFNVTTFSISNAPLPLTVHAPQSTPDSTSAPVLLFLHGFSLTPQKYSIILRHMASHGYILVAPQFPTNLFSTDASGDISSAAAVVEWLRTNYAGARPSSPLTASPDMSKLTLAGHSRSGKVAYGVGALSGAASVGAKAVFTLDPVDSASNQLQLPVDLNASSLIIGTGLGPLNGGFLNLSPACAPAATNYNYFYAGTSSTPVFQFRAKDYGHMDMLDSAGLTCRSRGTGLDLMRKFCAGTAVAFMRSVLDGNSSCFESLRATPSQFPVVVDEIRSK